jgi:drug/metabolite transporter (DMT)-like permease
MDLLWISLSVFAALMQSVRTAAQKTLNLSMSTLGTTYVRSLVGLPIMIVYLFGILAAEGGGIPPLGGAYLAATFLGALAQVLATMLLIYLFRLKNFAVGTMLTKVDIVMTAVLGMVFFSETVTLGGFSALLVVLAGGALMSIGKLRLGGLVADRASLAASLVSRPTPIALVCALLFTFSYLFLREATLLLEPGGYLWRGAWTVVLATAMQVAFVGIWVGVKDPASFGQIWPNRGLVLFIGTTSALGSIGWFTAFALQNASYVRAVGQIEVVFTLLISWLYFREKITALELVGIAVTVAGILMFRLVH